MFGYLLMLIMFNLYACLFTTIYWGYKKSDELLNRLQNCTTLIRRARLLKNGGAFAKYKLMFSISMTVTMPTLMSRSEIVSMEDVENIPRGEKIKLAILVWTTLGTLALMTCTWAVIKLAEYFYNC